MPLLVIVVFDKHIKQRLLLIVAHFSWRLNSYWFQAFSHQACLCLVVSNSRCFAMWALLHMTELFFHVFITACDVATGGGFRQRTRHGCERKKPKQHAYMHALCNFPGHLLPNRTCQSRGERQRTNAATFPGSFALVVIEPCLVSGS